MTEPHKNIKYIKVQPLQSVQAVEGFIYSV